MGSHRPFSVAIFAALVLLALVSAKVTGETTNTPTGEKFKFQAEVSRLMDIIIHSLYSNREVFLRELISNANDAIDKIRFQSLTDSSALDSDANLDIRISVDPQERTITVVDTGIGMTKKELITNLGTIAKSGTSSFLDQLSEDQTQGGTKTANLIGQFGVGFYSCFLVADQVTVISKNNNDTQWRWTSRAESGFTITEDKSQSLGRGTKIILHLRDDADDFLSLYKLEQLIKRYSEFIVFPIYLEKEVPVVSMKDEKVEAEEISTNEEAPKDESVEEDDVVVEKEDNEREAEEEEEPKTKLDWVLVNDVKPLWTRDPADVKEEEYISFFKSIAKTDEEPLTYIHFKAEGDVTFRGLLYIPKEPLRPLTDVNNEETQKQLVKLYVKRVLVTENVENGLLPSWLSFVIGIVDSDDMPINISRETLQESKTLKAIKTKLLRKALEALKKLMDEEASKDEKDAVEDGKKAMTPYVGFWKVYGPTLKMGLIMDIANRDRIARLVRLRTSKTDLQDPNDFITFDEYMDRMKVGQEYIYVHSGESLEAVSKSPFLEQLLDLGYEIIYWTDSVDEYLMQYYQEHQGTKLMSVAKDNFRLGSEDDDVIRAKAKLGKKRIKKLLAFLKKSLGEEKLGSVRTSMKLTRSACALSTEQFGYTARMETVMRAQALSNPDKVNNIPTQKVMEINPYHPVILGLNELIEAEPESPHAVDLAHALYDAALVSSGYYLHDHTAHGIRMARIMAERVGLDPNSTFEEPAVPEDVEEAVDVDGRDGDAVDEVHIPEEEMIM